MLKKNVPVKWTETHQRIIKNLQDELNKKPCLSHVNYENNCILQTDAADLGSSSILRQENVIIGYFSQKFTSQQVKYSIIEIEEFAVIQSLKQFKPIIYGSKIIVFIDHSNLQFLVSSKLQRCQR